METGKSGNDPETRQSTSGPGIIQTNIAAFYHCKIFEKILMRRLLSIAQEEEIISEHQFGFRVHHTTIEQVQIVTNVIQLALESKSMDSWSAS